MKKNICLLIFVLFCLNLFSTEESKIDWIKGKIYSYITVDVINDNNFAHNRVREMDLAKEKAKVNYYRILKNIAFSESLSVLDYLQSIGDKNRMLFTLIDQAHLDRIEYPNLDQIKLIYYINLYGKQDSLLNIILGDIKLYTEELSSYIGYSYSSNFSGIIIDARGQLTTYEGYEVNVKPAIFVTIKDDEGNIVFDKNNVYSDVIMQRGMVRYSYNINDVVSDRVGDNPLTIVAFGVGDRRGSIIVISKIDAKRMLSSENIKNAIYNGNIIIVVDQ